MPKTDAVPVRDEALAFLDSRRRSRARRAEAARIKWRRALRNRGAVAVVTLTALGGGVATAEQATKPPLLKKGARGASVETLQRALGIPADGIYGPQTRRAVRRFQRREGLMVDGIAGPATFEALGLATATEAVAVTGTRVLQAIARCESGGDPTAVSADGRYRGKYQFSRATWRALGGTGDPARAPEAEQDRLAAALYRREGGRPWPACSRSLRS